LQSLGALVTSAVLKSGPAASANECGSGQAGGRGRGIGTFWTVVIGVRAFCLPDFVSSFWSGFNFVLCCGDVRELSVGRRVFRCCRRQFCDAAQLGRKRSLENCACAAGKATLSDAAPVHAATTKTVAAKSQRESRILPRIPMLKRIGGEKFLPSAQRYPMSAMGPTA
jgi:hypothetical protein